MNRFQINASDITAYIKSHKKELEFNEVFFVEYMKRNNCMTPEGKIILIQKNNLMILPMSEFQEKMDYLNYMMESDTTFIDDNLPVKNLDFHGIVYTLIPLLKSNGEKEISLQRCYLLASTIADDLYIPSCDIYDLRNNPLNQVKQLLINCQIASYLKEINPTNNEYKITLSKKYCKGLLQSYEMVYGKEIIDQVKTGFQKIITAGGRIYE